MTHATTNTPKATLSTAGSFISRRAAFTCNGTLSGYSVGVHSSEKMGHERIRAFDRACLYSPDFYAVYSYETPIAWYAWGNWTVPNTFYSVTTSRHQNIVRKAVGL